MIRKYVVLSLLALLVCFTASGCFDTGSGGLLGQASATPPPQKEFSSLDAFATAVSAAKSDTSAQDTENLKGLTYYFAVKTLPDGAQVTSVKASTVAVIVGYSFGPVKQNSFDNQMQIVWYRSQDVNQYLGQVASTYTNYKAVSANGIDYLYINPDIQVAATPAPGADTAAPTPTPISTKYCQFVYWVQDGAAFMAAVPLNFTEADITKYCVGEKVDLE